MTVRVLRGPSRSSLVSDRLRQLVASERSPPTGVDELVIPTPSPDPADFVAVVDNPWLPLEPGRTWTYDVTDVRGPHALPSRSTAGRRSPASRPRPGHHRGGRRRHRLVRAGHRRQRLVVRPRGGVGRRGRTAPRRGWRWPPTRGSATATVRRTSRASSRTSPRSVVTGGTVPSGSTSTSWSDETLGTEPGASLQQSYARGIGLVERVASAGPSGCARLGSRTQLGGRICPPRPGRLDRRLLGDRLLGDRLAGARPPAGGGSGGGLLGGLLGLPLLGGRPDGVPLLTGRVPLPAVLDDRLRAGGHGLRGAVPWFHCCWYWSGAA